MNVYFIRHGETEYNRRHIHQDPCVPLSARGAEQIEQTAHILAELPITKLISSNMTRAVESARIIGSRLKMKPELNPLFREVHRPSQLYGKFHYGPATALIGLQMLAHMHDEKWHYGDEENLFDLKKRVVDAVEYLKSLRHEHKHVVVVSHSFIINLFLKYMCSYKDVRTRDYVHTLLSARKLGNGSITTVVYANDDNPYTCDWLCPVTDDRSHLWK